MDLAKVLAQLRQELEHIDAAISSLERLQARESRGRPPQALLELRKLKGVTPRRASSRRVQRGQTPN
jgi:hypothetical protein